MPVKFCSSCNEKIARTFQSARNITVELVLKAHSCTETGSLVSSTKTKPGKQTGQFRLVEMERSNSDLISVLGIGWIKQDNICKNTKCLGQLNACCRSSTTS